MKKIIYLGFIFVLIFSCNKYEPIENDNNDAIMYRNENNLAYTDEDLNLLLNTTAVSLFDYAQNPTFVAKIFNKAKEECSGDFEVLLKYINDSIDINFKNNYIENVLMNKSQIVYSKEVHNIVGDYPRQISSDTEIRDKAIEGDVREGKYFTQIFIPFLDRYLSSSMPKAIVVNSLDGTENEEFYGYEFSENGTITTKMISEDYAKNNLVWVISVNENIDNDILYDDYKLCKDSIENNYQIPEDTIELRNDVCKEYFVTDIYLKEDLERWVDGNSDVYCILAFMNADGSEKQQCTLTKLAELGESKLNKWINIGMKEITHSPDLVYCEQEVIDFIIFEKDNSKSIWERDFKPWRGVGQETGSKTYHYYSKERSFFSRTWDLCGRWYHEVPGFYWPTIDKVWDYNVYSGKSKTAAALMIQ